MYEVLHELLKDKKGGAIFSCFDGFHLCVIAFFLCLAVFACWYVGKKSKNPDKVINLFINLAIGLYALDFFAMPFAYGVIDIEKLPFHVCTTMCVMCFLSRYHPFFKKFRLQFAMLGFLSNLTYLIYPAGMMWHNIHPLSYRVVQTLAFHGVMMVYGALVLLYEGKAEFRWKDRGVDFLVISAMTCWAWLGNTLYNSELDFYNWFFVVRDPFSMFPEDISPFVMPFLNIAIFFVAELLMYYLFTKLIKVTKVKVA